MSLPPTPISGPGDVVRLLFRHPLRWLTPAAIVTLVVGIAAQQRPDTWEASQALTIRAEAAGNVDGPGRFRHSDEMKALLETILELAKNRGVLHAALAGVGPPTDRTSREPWPSAQEIADLADTVKLTPPKGAEYGKTEIFYLKVRDPRADRAIALATAICDQLELRFSKLRNSRAEGMVRELAETARLAEADAEHATAKLSRLEQEVGSDLAELRNLHQSSSGSESDLRRRRVELENELRQAQIVEHTQAELLKTLVAAQDDHANLLSAPNGLLESQPSLKKLKEGLLDAQLRTAQLLGSMSPLHPQVKASLAAEREIAQYVHNELLLAVRAVEHDWKLTTDRVMTLQGQLADVRGRLEKLAGLRAEYSALVAEADNRTKLLEEAQRRLVDAQASEAGANSASLISRIDTPDVGTKPVGPGKTTLLLAGLLGGLVVGIGLLFLSLPSTPPTTRPDTTARNAPAEGGWARPDLSLSKAYAKTSAA